MHNMRETIINKFINKIPFVEWDFVNDKPDTQTG